MTECRPSPGVLETMIDWDYWPTNYTVKQLMYLYALGYIDDNTKLNFARGTETNKVDGKYFWQVDDEETTD